MQELKSRKMRCLAGLVEHGTLNLKVMSLIPKLTVEFKGRKEGSKEGGERRKGGREGGREGERRVKRQRQ